MNTLTCTYYIASNLHSTVYVLPQAALLHALQGPKHFYPPPLPVAFLLLPATVRWNSLI